jgi:pentatricopeptide repeat protein
MSLGSRFVKRGKVAAFASLASTPREPLLFLYPPRIRNSSSARPASKPDSSSSTPFVTHENRLPTSSDLNLRGGTNKDVFIDTGSGKPRQEEIESEQKDVKAADRVHDIHNAEDRGPPLVVQIKATTMSPANYSSELNPTPPIVRKLYQKTMASKRNEARERSLRMEYQSNRRERTGSWYPDWRVVLSDLATSTPKNERWLDKVLNVLVPEDAVGKFLHGVDTNMWDIGERYGCSITLSSRDPEREECTSFLLSGPATAISQTTADIRRIAPNIELKTTLKSLNPSSDETMPSSLNKEIEAQASYGPKVRIVKSGKDRRAQIVRADKIPRPAEWTQRSFLDYVTDLTSVEMPFHMRQVLYKDDGESHTLTVMRILQSIFKDPDCRSSISRKAFNTAMAYLVKVNRIRVLRRFFVRMEMMDIPPEVETFNIMLRGTAKAEDLHNFHFIFHLMRRRGIAPNAKTWIAFMMAIPDFRIKLYILAAMKEKGLMRQVSTVKAVCDQLVSQEISTSLDKSQSQEQFLLHMDALYGSDWLTLSSANQILHALGARGLVSRSWDFLAVMTSRFVEPNHVSISTILNHCRHSLNVAGAVEIMKNLPPSSRLIQHESIYDQLFSLAWRSRSYNLARVVWKYACLNGLTTWRMRKLVRSSLGTANSEKKEAENSRRRWDQQAGVFIITNGYVNDRPISLPGAVAGNAAITEPDVSSNLPVIWRLPFNRRWVLRGVLKRLQVEYSVFKHFGPGSPFEELLAEACERDKEWKSLASSDVSKESRSLSWKLERAITVPIHHREPYASTPGDTE